MEAGNSNVKLILRNKIWGSLQTACHNSIFTFQLILKTLMNYYMLSDNQLLQSLKDASKVIVYVVITNKV